MAALENNILTIMTDGGPAGLAVRGLLPRTIGVFLGLAALHLVAEQQGFYGGEVGNLVFALANVTALAGIIWSEGDRLLRSDIERRKIEVELRRRATLDLLTNLPNRGVSHLNT